jgi:hypothetical protein
VTDAETSHDEPIASGLRELIAELDAWLPAQPEDAIVPSVLPFASEWVLKDVEGLDVERYTDESRRFVLATPLADRVLLRFEDDAVFWLAGLMLLDEQYEPQPERAREVLAAAKAEIAARADVLEQEGFPSVAAGFRRLLTESADGTPPTDVVWRALALRIIEPFLEDPVNVVPLETPAAPAEPEAD